MAFGPSDANIKLNAPDTINGNYAVAGLNALERQGVIYQIVSKLNTTIPDPDGILTLRNHFQGAALREGYAMVTTSAKGGVIITATGNEKTFLLDQIESVDGLQHPGGIQTIGSYLVVPAYDPKDQKRGSEIRFYRYREHVEWIEHLTIKRRGQRLYCLGITNPTGPDGDYYILAVASHSDGDIIEFYYTEPGIPLSNPQCSFVKRSERQTDTHTPHAVWNINTVRQNPQNFSDWEPDQTWGGYPNSLSLLADEAGNVYLLGLHRDTSGDDWADLYHLDVNAPEATMLTKMANFHAIAKRGPSFRYGGSAMVTSNHTLSIFACARNTRGNGTELVLNVFHSAQDPIYGSIV